MKKIKLVVIVLMLTSMFISCSDDDKYTPIETAEYDDTMYVLEYGELPAPDLPADNPLTEQGVLLGKMLFYEKSLSSDGSQNCATCHKQPEGFSDSDQFSIGVEGLPGKRQAMAIFNMAWHGNQFFWDGRANLLRDQSLLPIQDPLEMNETLENVIVKLENNPIYPNQFIRAFGTSEITAHKMSLAMEQFMLSIVSYNSKYDRVLIGQDTFTESEARGKELFETEYNEFFPNDSGADCRHCHGGANFENDNYMNNGIDNDANATDIGREDVTGSPADRAKFKVPSLRNIAVSAPYMHDGRFQTLEEVLNHYNSGIQTSSTVDPALLHTQSTGLFLDAQKKEDIINFLKTLTDDVYLNNEEYKDPFE